MQCMVFQILQCHCVSRERFQISESCFKVRDPGHENQHNKKHHNE